MQKQKTLKSNKGLSDDHRILKDVKNIIIEDTDYSQAEDSTFKAHDENRNFMNFDADISRDNLYVFSESDDECKGKRIRTYSYEPENYEPAPGGMEAGTGHVPYASSKKRKFKSNQLPPQFLNKLKFAFKDNEKSSSI